jgi:hypothetical protein
LRFAVRDLIALFGDHNADAPTAQGIAQDPVFLRIGG